MRERIVAPGSLCLVGAEKTTVMRPPTKGGSPEKQSFQPLNSGQASLHRSWGVGELADQSNKKKNRAASIFS